MDHAETDRFLSCPSCGAAMRFLQTKRLDRVFRELQTFECRPCRLTVTAEQVLLQFPELLSAWFIAAYLGDFVTPMDRAD